MTTTPGNQAAPRPHLRATLLLACLAQFMVILDVSVVNVALPSIRRHLGFTEADLQWVVNGYTVTFAGFLLLGGRAADLLGRRRVFVAGLVAFALASLAGGLSDSRSLLIVARAVQGIGGAVIAPASLSILTTTFTEPAERNRAVGIWGAMGGGGGAAGVVLGGLITQALSWRWILFINVPIGLAAALAARELIAEGRDPDAARSFDFAGALSATGGLSVVVLAIVRTDAVGWGSAQVLGLLGAGLALLGAFVVIEGRLATAPLMPLRIYRARTLTAANLVVLTLGATTFGMWFFCTLYLQQVLGYSPLEAGLAFLPMTSMIVAASFAASRAVGRFGAKRLLVAGMLTLAVGQFLFLRISVGGGFLNELLAPGLLSAVGMAFAFVPGTICATSGVSPEEAGLASGLVNTARLFGGALGLAVLATLATSRTDADLRRPTAAIHTADAALVSGFHLAFLLAGVLGCTGAVIAAVAMPRVRARAAAAQPLAAEI